MPDYAGTNDALAKDILTRYPSILWSIVKLYWKHPRSSMSTSVLLLHGRDLLLDDAHIPIDRTTPNYSSGAVGLFGLMGAATLVLGPLFGKFVITPLKEPLYSVLVVTTITLVGNIPTCYLLYLL